MTHSRIMAMKSVAANYRAANQHGLADIIDDLADECVRLRQGLWDVAKVCGADTDGDDTPAALVSDIVEFTRRAAEDSDATTTRH
jgi:hypothetical protein